MEKHGVKEKISEGWLHCRVIIEILGKPKEHVEKTLRTYVAQIKEKKDIAMIDEFYSEPEQHGEKKELYSVFAELELLAKAPETLVWLCFDYMPSSIEIIEPEHLRYKKADFAALVNDLLARLHDVDMKYKNLLIDRNLIERSNEIMIRRVILAALEHKPKTLEELSQAAGVDMQPLFIFLGSMINDGLIKKEGEKYRLAD